MSSFVAGFSKASITNRPHGATAYGGGGLCFPWWQDLVPFFFTGISSMVKPVRLDQNCKVILSVQGLSVQMHHSICRLLQMVWLHQHAPQKNIPRSGTSLILPSKSPIKDSFQPYSTGKFISTSRLQTCKAHMSVTATVTTK